MKFDCGITYGEKCKIKRQWRENWHQWFALIPRRVGPRECRWLEHIERSGDMNTGASPNETVDFN